MNLKQNAFLKEISIIPNAKSLNIDFRHSFNFNTKKYYLPAKYYLVQVTTIIICISFSY